MAAQGMHREDVSKIIKKSITAVSNKLNGKVEWKFNECLAVTNHFKKIYPERSLTNDFIFSDVEVATIADGSKQST